MITATKVQSKVKHKLVTDPFTKFETHMFRYRGRDYSLNFVPVKGEVSYKLFEEYWNNDGSFAGAGEFYTSHYRFKTEQAALKDAAMTIQEMDDWQSWAEDVDAEHEAMVDSHR